MVAYFTLDFEGARAPMLLLQARQDFLKLAEPVFGTLCRCALDDQAAHKRFLVYDALLSFAQVWIGQERVVSPPRVVRLEC